MYLVLTSLSRYIDKGTSSAYLFSPLGLEPITDINSLIVISLLCLFSPNLQNHTIFECTAHSEEQHNTIQHSQAQQPVTIAQPDLILFSARSYPAEASSRDTHIHICTTVRCASPTISTTITYPPAPVPSPTAITIHSAPQPDTTPSPAIPSSPAIASLAAPTTATSVTRVP